MKAHIKDDAQVSVNKGFKLNKKVSDDCIEELCDTVKDIVNELVENGNLYEEYCLIADYRLRWRRPNGESRHICEIGLELTHRGKTIGSWDIRNYLPRMTVYILGRTNYTNQLSWDITAKLYSYDTWLHTPKTMSISEFCKQLTDCVYWDITPQNIEITDRGLTLTLPDYTRVDFVCSEGYIWYVPDGVDAYTFTDFSFYANGLDDIMLYLADNDIDLDTIGTSENE